MAEPIGTNKTQVLGTRHYFPDPRNTVFENRLSFYHMTEAKKNWAESRQLRVGAMLPTAQRRPDLRITGEDQSGAPPGGGSTQNRS